MVRIILNGCCGKMGRMVSQCTALYKDMEIVAGVDRTQTDPPLPFPIYGQCDEVRETADVIIDFSRPEGLSGLLSAAVAMNLPLVLATTGLTQKEHALVEEASRQIAVFQSANLSVGIKVMQQLLTQATRLIGEDSDIEIVESHHNQKVDAPSGTALALAETIQAASGESLHYVFGRHGRNCPRQKKEIGIHALRGGTVTGEHEVFFFGQDEILSVKHHAASRQVFAIGALKAARFLAGQAPGRYGMDDMLRQSAEPALYVKTDCLALSLPAADAAALLKRLALLEFTPLYTAWMGGSLLHIVDSTQGEAFLRVAHALGAEPQYKNVTEIDCAGSALPGNLPGRILSALGDTLAPLALTGEKDKLRFWFPAACGGQAAEKIKQVMRQL
jgi:4-hydroxy-tetrahydrodipicolinate reductase